MLKNYLPICYQRNSCDSFEKYEFNGGKSETGETFGTNTLSDFTGPKYPEKTGETRAICLKNMDLMERKGKLGKLLEQIH